MVINIGRSTSDATRLSKDFTSIISLNAQIKENTDVVDPTFIIETPNTYNFNYVKVAAWGRDYFVRNITALPGNRTAVSCHVDVLSSFASQIRGCTAIIDKQRDTAKTSPYIDDGSYVVQCDQIIQSYNFPTAFNAQSTILITAGGD